MAAALVQIFTYVDGVGRELQKSTLLEPIWKTLSVSSDGTDHGTKISEVSGKFDMNNKKLSNVAAGAASGEVLTFEMIGANSGIAPLDSGGKVPVAYLPNSIMQYIQVWNATTNTPALADYADGTAAGVHIGDVYKVSVAGSQDLGSGSIDFAVGDYAIVNSSGKFEKAHAGADAVVSVNGQAGIVVLTTSNIAEGTNLYFTTGHFDTAFATKTTDDLTEGSTNKYYHVATARTDLLASSVTNGDTTHAPTGDAVFDAIAAATPTPVLPLTNTEGAGMTVGQAAFQSDFGEAKLLGASVAGVTEDSLIVLVKDATIADTTDGDFYLPGQIVSGYTAATFVANAPVYASKATPGAFQQDQTGFTVGDKVIKLGYPISDTALLFQPEFEYVIG